MPGKLFIGRQPIVDRHMNVTGYELLFRAAEEDVEARFENGDLASSRVIVSTFLEIGIDHIVGSRRAYVNLTRPFLTGDMPLPMGPEQVALEVLEDIAADERLLAGLRHYRSEGYMIVLDDFRLTPESRPLLDLADAVKLDVLALDSGELEHHVRLARERGITVIAERVETPEMFDRCLVLGCDLFQGYFFCHPKVVHGQPLPDDRAVLLPLLARLEDPGTGAGELERLISQDVTLSYRLLRYSTFALRREIHSLHDAMVLLGLRAIRNWASLILYARIDSPKPPELRKTAMIRARMCERLAQELNTADPSQAFTVGLLSTLDALLDRPMDEILAGLPLNAPVKRALLDREGPMGDILDRVLSHEQGRWRHLCEKEVDDRLHNRAYLDAVAWAEESSGLLGEIQREPAGR